MSPRPRKSGRSDWPPRLIVAKRGRRHYYYWDDPLDGNRKSLQCPDDLATAKRRATELNAIRAQQVASTRVLQIAQIAEPQAPRRSPPLAVHDWLDRYLEQIAERVRDGDYKPSTLANRRHCCTAIRRAHGEIPLAEITTKDIAELLNGYRSEGKARMAQSIRATYIDALSAAVEAGEIQSNPAKATRQPRAKTRRARLTLEDYNAILEHLSGWPRNAALLALVTGQRRGDVRNMQFRHVRNGWLHVAQGKTGARLRIATNLRLDAIGISVADVVTQCRDQVLSSYMIHHTHHAGRARPGDRVRAATLAQEFAKAAEYADPRGAGWVDVNG